MDMNFDSARADGGSVDSIISEQKIPKKKKELLSCNLLSSKITHMKSLYFSVEGRELHY